MKLRHLLRRLLPAELQALAEKVESLDPVGCDEDRSWLVLHAGAFMSRQNNDTLGLWWYERHILAMEFGMKYRALTMHDAMALVMRVPSEDSPTQAYGRNLARAMTSTKNQLSEKIVLRRKQESV